MLTLVLHEPLVTLPHPSHVFRPKHIHVLCQPQSGPFCFPPRPLGDHPLVSLSCLSCQMHTPGAQKLRCQPGLGMVWGFVPNTSAPGRRCPRGGWAGTLTPFCHRPCCRTGLCRWPARSPALPLHSSPVCCRLQLWGRTSRKVGEPAPPRSPSPGLPGYLVGQRQGRREWEAQAS